jgi:hypothetical protein
VQSWQSSGAFEWATGKTLQRLRKSVEEFEGKREK